MKKVCIATYEIEKIHKNGGIATAYKHMADALVREGFDVTILVTSNMNFSQKQLNEFVDIFARDNIKLIYAKDVAYPVKGICDTYCSYQAYRTFETLKDYNFDIIHIPDSSGDAYFVVHAKRSGLYFQNTTIIVGAHGSSEWVRESNENASLSNYDNILDCLERDSIAYADYVVSPSNYYIDWMKEHEFKFPKKIFSILNCPHMDSIKPKNNRIESKNIKEIVFFGRQERRKGFDVFCDAILNFDLPENIMITFLGKPTNTCSFDTYRDAFKDKKYKVNFIENYNSKQAIEYLQKDGVVAVIPSRSETMCYTVMECLLNGIPFIAANTGAIHELIDSQYHKEVLFDINWKSLKEKFIDIFKYGLSVARPSFNNDDIFHSWIDLHNNIINENNYAPSRVALLNINGNTCKVELENQENEYVFSGFDDDDFISTIENLDTDYILLSFNTEYSSRAIDVIKHINKKENTAVLLANFNSNGAFLGTSSRKESFELISSNQLLQYNKNLPIPNSCIVYKKDFLKFIKLHGNMIYDSYYFMKVFILFLILNKIDIFTVPIACGWSASLYINKDFEKQEKMLWLKYYRKIFKLHPDVFGRDSVSYVEVYKNKDLTREEKLRAKFIKSPKRFCADSKHLSLRILSKFLSR